MKKMTESNALLNVLCLEDVLKDAELLNEMLVDAGYLVSMDIAAGEKEYLSFLKGRNYDIILADYTLPGFGASAALKLALELQPAVPFICVSGTIGDDKAVEFLKQGATDYVLKNSLGRLAFAIRRALEDVEKQKELKKVEQTMRESEAKYQAIFESTGTATFIIEEDNTILMANNECYSIMGYTPTKLIGQKWSQYFAPESESLQEMLKNHQLTRQNPDLAPKKYEVKLVNKKGEIRDVIVDVGMIPGTKQSIVSISDVTERKRAGEALVENEKRYRELFDNAPVGYHELDINGLIIRINRTELDMLGYTEKEMIGQFIWKFVGDEDISQQRVLGKLKGIILPAIGAERVYRRKDLTTFPASVEEIILRDAKDNIIGIRTTIQDITERKRAEEENVMLAHSLKSINECVSITDMEDKLIFVNQSFLKTYGYNENELIGKHISIVRSLDTAPASVEEILPATLSGEWKGELLNKRKDGTEFLIYLSTTIINDKDGKPLGLIGVAKDITESKRAGEALQRSEADLKEAQRIGRLGNWDWDTTTNTIIWSEEYYYIFGIDPTQPPPGYEEYLKLYTTESAAQLDAAVKKSMQTGKGYQLDLEKAHLDGTSRWITAIGEVKHDDKGQIVGLRGTAQDITARKRTEEELKKRSAFIQTVLDNLPIGIALNEIDKGNTIYTNKKFEEIYGWSKDEMKDVTDFFEKVYPDKKYREELMTKVIADIQSGDPSRMHWEGSTVTHKDGSKHIINAVNIPLFEQNTMVSTAIDITEQQLAEEELLKLSRAVEQSPASIIITDTNGNIEYVNPKVTEITGYQ